MNCRIIHHCKKFDLNTMVKKYHIRCLIRLFKIITYDVHVTLKPRGKEIIAMINKSHIRVSYVTLDPNGKETNATHKKHRILYI